MRSPRNYLLALLTLIMVFNYVDRVALGLLAQEIKTDLHLSDTQLGLLTGIAFALFYAGMGIPIARWADRGDRVTIIALTTGLWSAAVALCATATSFLRLMITRVGVAVGEAGCHPPAFSLIADYFPRPERPRAIARYMLGWPLALLTGYFAAGWINQFYGWRKTFLVIGLPGVLLALLAKLTLHEPRRGTRAESASTAPTEAPSGGHSRTAREVLLDLWGNKPYRHLLLCCSLSYFFGNGILQWQPTFFLRSHGFQTGELGTWLALIYGIGGLLGTYLGGELASRFAAGNERVQLKAIAWLYLAFVAIDCTVYLAPTRTGAFSALALSSIGEASVSGPLFAATQTLVPADMRAISIALVLFFCNLIGLGLGPLSAGALSDALRPWLGDESLRFALLALCPGYLWCSWHLWQASRSVPEALNVREALT